MQARGREPGGLELDQGAIERTLYFNGDIVEKGLEINARVWQ